MASLFFRRKKHADITIPAGVDPCSAKLSFARNSYSKRLDESLSEVLTELVFKQIKNQTDKVMNGEATLASRKDIALRIKCIMFSFAPLAAGFLAGIPLLAIGASDEEEDLLTPGIVLICFFVLGLVSVLYNATRFLSATTNLKASGFEVLSNNLLPALTEQHPLLRFELVGLDKKAKIGTLRISLSHVPVAAVIETSAKEPVATKYTV